MHRSTKNHTTKTAAAILGIKPGSMATAVYRKGGYCGITPAKLPNGRLLWPADEIDALASGARAHEAPHTGERLAAARAGGV